MNPSDASMQTRFKVGIFTVLGLFLIGSMTVFVNHKPFWWRSCQLVHINVEDGTGLKNKSPIRSLGIEIGYLKTVDLYETHVDLGICITAPVEVLPSTRAYLRGEGFLGDKFVELKPVKYVGPKEGGSGPSTPALETIPEPSPSSSGMLRRRARASALSFFQTLDSWVASSRAASAEAPKPAASEAPPAGDAPLPARVSRRRGEGREIPVGEQGQDVQHLVNRVDSLVNEMTNLTTNLKQAINPEELRGMMKQLNRTLENASRTLSPEGGLNQTAQRTLAKLEDAIEQLRDMMTRTNKGEGSVGMLLNDPSYADEIREVIRNANRLLSRVGTIRFVIDIGGDEIPAYNGGRGRFQLRIYPKPDYYYLIGIALDPRGKITDLNTTTTVGGISTPVQTRQIEQTGLLLTGMFGKILYDRLDLAVGALYGDGAFSAGLRLGPLGREEMLVVRNDVYSRGSDYGVDDRISVILQPFIKSGRPWHTIYVKGGLEGFKGVGISQLTPWSYGAGITFDDDDIKLLFVLR